MSAGLSSLIAQAFGGLSSIASSQKNYDNSMSMLQFQNQWNSPKAQLERAKEAGLNPNAVAQTLAGSAGFGSMAAADAASLPNAVPDLGAMIGNSVNSALNAEFVKSQIKDKKEETRGKKLVNDLKETTFADDAAVAHNNKLISDNELEKSNIIAERFPDFVDTDLATKKETLRKTTKEIDKLQKDIEVSDQNIAESKKRIDKLEQDIKTAKSQEAKNYAETALTKEKTKLAQLENENQEMKNRNLDLSGNESGWIAEYFAIKNEKGVDAADAWLEDYQNVVDKVVKNTSKASAQGQNEAYDETVQGRTKRELEKERDEKIANERKAIEELRGTEYAYLISDHERNIKAIYDEYNKKIAEADKGHRTSAGLNIAGYGINFSE